ncbi:MAG: FecR domain-containing protein [Verrucomicrobia bacterium]|nr:FecR domain-containing protein [Verrucomicrobiota bacterium]
MGLFLHRPTQDELIQEAAARWLARRDAGWLAGEREAFESWYSSDSRHAAAWDELTAAWLAFDQPLHDGQADAMVRELGRRRHRRTWRRSIAVAAGAVGVAAAVTLALWLRPEGNRGNLWEVTPQRLADGTEVEAAPGAKYSVAFEPAKRLIRLEQGAVHFRVAHDSARPFVVSTHQVSVQAVGTAFSVEAGSSSVEVVVTEGRVAVERDRPAGTNSPGPMVLADAGQHVAVPLGAGAGAALQAESLPAAELARRLAWREPRVELDNTRLEDAANLFNRVNRLQLVVPDRELADMRLSGTFRASDPEGFVRLLEANYRVAAAREAGTVALRRK